MKTFNARKVVKVRHNFKWNAFESVYSLKVTETITYCTYFLDSVIPLSSEIMYKLDYKRYYGDLKIIEV